MNNMSRIIFSGFTKRWGERAISDSLPGGFTLLEVLIALAILAIGYSALLGSQARSLASATEAKFNILAPLLAGSKLAELQANGLTVAENDGDFGEEYPGFTWKIEAEDAEFGNEEPLQMKEQVLKRYDLTIAWADTGLDYTVRYYGFPTE
jgi:general secretion pathway protein I